MPASLSASQFLSGLQCHKRLYLDIHSPDLATEIDDVLQGRFDMGTEVGILAHGRFPGGALVADRDLSQALEHTARLVQDSSVRAIFEATFEFNGVIVKVDILERAQNGTWNLIEVKSATDLKDEYFDDAAIQAYAVKGAGLQLSGASVMHLNNKYVYEGGELDLAQLFTVKNITTEVNARQAAIPHRVEAMVAMLASNVVPSIEPDGHCDAPYPCGFFSHCRKAKPARWVYDLPRITEKKFQKLVGLGIECIDDIPENFKLSVAQQRMKTNIEWMSPDLKFELESVRYPVHHVDFETFMLAIPRYPMTKPYQVLAFQWSNHIEAEDGTVRHEKCISTSRKDPDEEIAVTLLESLGKEGSICVFSNYEKTTLAGLGEKFPHLKPMIELAIGRLWDLQSIIGKHYYHPAFNGSFSLKVVLPALMPALKYDDLEIQNGGQASQQYYKIVFGEISAIETESIKSALLKYCERDTWAMVELRRVLRQKSYSA